jgi:hypothetical protein
MGSKTNTQEVYKGFEQGPIRPPSEASSLLIRVTRNCPWNHCAFCPVYKKTRFSIRPADHVKQDIDAVHKYLEMILARTGPSGRVSPAVVQEISLKLEPDESPAFYAALNWCSGGLKSVFIQDANSLVIHPEDLVDILIHLKKRFPWVERVTSYARSHTIARIKDGDLKAIQQAGLNRIHIGLESGSDAVLEMVKKGCSKAMHIKAGLKVKAAGMELSEYVMPGLGGQDLSRDHALETADALNQINPDFIRLRTLAIPGSVPLFKMQQSGQFKKPADRMMAGEIKLLIENLNKITSVFKSDHILNLFQEVEGTFPDDQNKMLNILTRFLDMPPQDQCLYQVGRRLGIFHTLEDMSSPHRLRKVEKICQENSITPENVDEVVSELMNRFI